MPSPQHPDTEGPVQRVAAKMRRVRAGAPRRYERMALIAFQEYHEAGLEVTPAATATCLAEAVHQAVKNMEWNAKELKTVSNEREQEIRRSLLADAELLRAALASFEETRP